MLYERRCPPPAALELGAAEPEAGGASPSSSPPAVAVVVGDGSPSEDAVLVVVDVVVDDVVTWDFDEAFDYKKFKNKRDIKNQKHTKGTCVHVLCTNHSQKSKPSPK